jgi:hypothetical protein
MYKGGVMKTEKSKRKRHFVKAFRKANPILTKEDVELLFKIGEELKEYQIQSGYANYE